MTLSPSPSRLEAAEREEEREERREREVLPPGCSTAGRDRADGTPGCPGRRSMEQMPWFRGGKAVRSCQGRRGRGGDGM